MAQIREATHAGSWYTDNGEQLNNQLQTWLDSVPAAVSEIEPEGAICTVPVRGARAIIGPHAGLSYSGATAAYAYKCIDVSKVRRVFLLGPSHHVYLEKCALSKCNEYETPLGNLIVDQETVQELRTKWGDEWQTMSLKADEDEHSLEMHLPFIYKVFEEHIDQLKLVPIMVGNLRFGKEQRYGEMLAPYLADEQNFFIISSDFCHWGSRFRYTLYQESEDSHAAHLGARARSGAPGKLPIWESIKRLDWKGMEAIATMSHEAFAQYLAETENTICGRHPIGVILAAINTLYSPDQLSKASSAASGDGSATNDSGPRLRFVKYDQSSKVFIPSDSSVSYASAYLYLPS
ncbi:hypothetical protein EDC05_004222 [Coemansia umbellata]|uniref:Uncharacterized protein n=1 Tax=Coemansia umbellata TaxID=1424467 RepID=A0ABQ8PL14_9FUNG|nr:hypothetical protein EDC05_004222 [Coemansia umbellata]